MKRANAALAAVCALGVWFTSARSDDQVDEPGKLDSVLGREVTTAQDRDVGRIIDLLVDDQGVLRAAVVEFGGFLGIGTRKIAIEWSAFQWVGYGVTVQITRAQLRAAPEVKAGAQPFVVRSVSE